MTNSPVSPEPTITVAMSVYNSERWLAESISSVLGQTYRDFEFVIVNDGSTDGSLQIIQSFASLDRRVRVIRKTNSGLADSLNHGIAHAKGTWIARIDADDICEPQRLELQLEFARSHPSLVLLGSGLLEIDEDGHARGTYRYPAKHSGLVSYLKGKRRFFPHSSAFFRRASFHRVGGYRPRIKRAQDYDLWLRLSEVGEIACLRPALICIRRHGGQISHDEGGRRQILDSRVALASYILRQIGVPDPVADTASENEFEAFRCFIAAGLEGAKLFDQRKLIDAVKVELQRGAPWRALATVFSRPDSPELFLRYCSARIAGESITQKLIKNWIGR